MERNHYGSLCTEMYEILHGKAPEDELGFYLSYVRKDMRILEALCGSGRFMVPFLERGYTVCGVDSSSDMLAKLKQKKPQARIFESDILEFDIHEDFDYVFISSGSVSLFVDPMHCKALLRRIKNILAPDGVFVFAVDTIANRCNDDDDYVLTASGMTSDGFKLLLKTKNHYIEESQTQLSPGIYELYDGNELLMKEEMDFQTHLYRAGEMEMILEEVGFKSIKTYSSFSKNEECDDESEMFLFECRLHV